jgi:hypothetical protein
MMVIVQILMGLVVPLMVEAPGLLAFFVIMVWVLAWWWTWQCWWVWFNERVDAKDGWPTMRKPTIWWGGSKVKVEDELAKLNHGDHDIRK